MDQYTFNRRNPLIVCSALTLRRRLARRAAPLVLAGLGLILGGCASLSGGAPQAEDIVRERAQIRWNAQVAGDWKKAYSLSAPSYRAVVSPDQHRARLGGAAQWVAAEVVSVSCEAESCAVRVRLDFRPVVGPRVGDSASTYVTERWVREEGQWWLFQRL